MEGQILVFLPSEPKVPIRLSPEILLEPRTVLGRAVRILAMYLPTLDPTNVLEASQGNAPGTGGWDCWVLFLLKCHIL